MKLNIKIDAGAKEPEIMITTAHMTEDINRVVVLSRVFRKFFPKLNRLNC